MKMIMKQGENNVGVVSMHRYIYINWWPLNILMTKRIIKELTFSREDIWRRLVNIMKLVRKSQFIKEKWICMANKDAEENQLYSILKMQK